MTLTPRQAFESYVYERVVAMIVEASAALERWPNQVPYVMSLFVSDLDDDPRQPGVALAWEYLPADYGDAGSAEEIARWNADQELRWNYAAFSQDLGNTIGYPFFSAAPPDHEGMALIDSLFEGLVEAEFSPRFVRSLLHVVRSVQRERLVERHLARSLPLLVHTLGYNMGTARQNVEANGLERTADFVDWIRGSYPVDRRAEFDRQMATANARYARDSG